MQSFIERHSEHITGVLSGFDRLVFRGIQRSISYPTGMCKLLSCLSILLKDFGSFVERASQEVKRHAEQIARKANRPYLYIPLAKTSKEDLAKKIMVEHKITQGLVCVLTCVEPCQAFGIHKNSHTGHLELVSEYRKCLFIYYYFLDREFGLMHVRLQTWFPFSMQVCVNGREYLKTRLDQLGIGYEMRDNCFARIDDLPRAQQILDQLIDRRWDTFLNALARRVNPWLSRRAGRQFQLFPYYWTVRQAEFATDVMFRDEAALQAVYSALVDHGLRHFQSDNILRFLGRRTNCLFSGEVKTIRIARKEGVCLRHWVEENSIKMYDKQGCVLRVETTINNPGRFKVRRWVTREGRPCLAWVALRKGIADMARRAEIARAANERYLEALSVVGIPAPTHEVLDPIQRPITQDGRRYRGLRPLTSHEAALFRAILRGEYAIQGFRNADVRHVFSQGNERDPAVRRRVSGQATRWLRLMRAHRLIKKVSGTRYYRVTKLGHRAMTTALRLREFDLSILAA